MKNRATSTQSYVSNFLAREHKKAGALGVSWAQVEGQNSVLSVSAIFNEASESEKESIQKSLYRFLEQKYRNQTKDIYVTVS